MMPALTPLLRYIPRFRFSPIRITAASLLCLTLFYEADAKTFAQERMASVDAAIFTSFEVSGAGKGIYQGTYALGINTLGTVTGYYIDSQNVYHGFVRTTNGTITTFNAPGAGKQAYDGT